MVMKPKSPPKKEKKIKSKDRENTYSNMIGLFRLGPNGYSDADNAKEHVGQRPPGKVGEALAAGGDGHDGRNKGNEPGELQARKHTLATVPYSMRREQTEWLATYNGDADGGQGEGVTEDGAHAKATTISVSVFHLVE